MSWRREWLDVVRGTTVRSVPQNELLRGLLIIVVGLAFEARIAAGPGIHVVCGGDGRHLTATLTAAIAEARTLFGDCPGDY